MGPKIQSLLLTVCFPCVNTNHNILRVMFMSVTHVRKTAWYSREEKVEMWWCWLETEKLEQQKDEDSAEQRLSFL